MGGKEQVLITGAGGFLGSRTVEILVDRGFEVRALDRKTSRTDHISPPGVEICCGDVTEVESLRPAFKGVDYVIHLAADTSGTEEGGRRVTIQGTKNILDLCASHSIKKLIYISSCSVYGVADYEPGKIVDENALLERFPERRGPYSWAKFEAEKLVTDFMLREKVPVVCLRPGTIYGFGGEYYSSMVGFSLRRKIFAVIGNGEFVLPLVYIDDLVEAILLAISSEKSDGQVYNVVDPHRIDKKQYANSLIRKLYPDAWIFYFPYGLLSATVMLQEKLFSLLKRQPILTNYRLISSQKPIFYDSSKIMNDLGWKSLVSFDEAVERIVAAHGQSNKP